MDRYHSDAVDALKREAAEAKAGEIEYKRVDSDHQTALQALHDQVNPNPDPNSTTRPGETSMSVAQDLAAPVQLVPDATRGFSVFVVVGANPPGPVRRSGRCWRRSTRVQEPSTRRDCSADQPNSTVCRQGQRRLLHQHGCKIEMCCAGGASERVETRHS